MVTIPSLISRLKKDYPQFSYQESSACSWEPSKRMVLYSSHAEPAQVLHEVGHALLGHEAFERDISLLAVERAAWMYAKRELAATYGVIISEDTIEQSLDTYRDWLHKRSLCPHCEVSGIQQTRTTYRCTICDRTWKVNDARSCQLRRTVMHS